jgi:hypothetical protein
MHPITWPQMGSFIRTGVSHMLDTDIYVRSNTPSVLREAFGSLFACPAQVRGQNGSLTQRITAVVKLRFKKQSRRRQRAAASDGALDAVVPSPLRCLV